MKKTAGIKLTVKQLIELLEKLSENQQAYISGYAQALADTKN